MGRRQNGIRERAGSIQIDFYYQGIRCRETLKMEPTKANLKHAEGKKAAIQHEISIGTFNYAAHFPNSPKVYLTQSKIPKTIEQALDDFLEAKRKTCEYSTWKDYRSAVEYHLKPIFGKQLIQNLTTSQIRSWINTLDISNKRINNILVPLRGMLDDAHADGLIDRNPMLRIKNLTTRMEDPQPFTPDEIGRIMEQLPEQSCNMFLFAIWTGLRTSELIALEWGDIDWQAELIRVRRATVLRKTKAPKTKAGYRDIKLLPPAYRALINQKPLTYMQGGNVFHNPRTNAPWVDAGQIRQSMWLPALRRAKVVYRNPYQTRHTYASMMLSGGENPLWVAQQMGHKDWGMIRKRYGRWIPELDNTAGSKAMSFWSQDGHTDNATTCIEKKAHSFDSRREHH